MFFLMFFWDGATISQSPFLWVRQKLVKKCTLYNSGEMLQWQHIATVLREANALEKSLYSDKSHRM